MSCDRRAENEYSVRAVAGCPIQIFTANPHACTVRSGQSACSVACFTKTPAAHLHYSSSLHCHTTQLHVTAAIKVLHSKGEQKIHTFYEINPYSTSTNLS